jgi:hypothetical protein
MLLKKADTLTELSIRSLKEWRLWLELKRLKEDIKLQLKNDTLDQIQKIEGFRVGKAKIKLKEDKLQVELKENQLKFSYSEFIRNPRGVLNKIMELIYS